MTKRQIYYSQLVQYLSEPKENDPFDSFRVLMLGKTKDFQNMEDNLENAFKPVPGVNMNESDEPDTDSAS